MGARFLKHLFVDDVSELRKLIDTDETNRWARNMSKQQQYLMRAAQELGLRFTLDYVVTLPDGKAITFPAHFPDLSNPSGMLVANRSTEIDTATRKALIDQGLGLSTYGEPPSNEIFEIEGYIEMFSEWGWSGEDDSKPWWME